MLESSGPRLGRLTSSVRQHTVSSPQYPCPSCGFLVFEEPVGSYDICGLCGWEDDPVQLASPGLRGGANGGSLKDYQDDALKEYPESITHFGEYVRAPGWRPLRSEECSVSTPGDGTGIGYFHAAVKADPSYYWLSNA
ncbi:MAG: hypothetical protein IPL96_04050 [Holophagaceae bacterium]|nr:hypothetical protein [Holophagaceae bacterium]